MVQSTCTDAIGHLRGAFSDQGITSADPELALDEYIELADGIQRALFEFDSTSNHAVLRMYRRVDVHGSTTSPFPSGSDNEHVFLVYLYVGHVISFRVLSFAEPTCPPLLASYSPWRSLRGSSSP